METTISTSSSYLTFRLDEEVFAATVNKVLEILEIPKITKIPRSPEFMRGVLNLRGSVLPVIDTRKKFNLPLMEDSVNTCIIVMSLVIDEKPIVIGAVVDSVQEVMEIDSNEVQPAPTVGSKYKTEFIEGMLKSNDQFIMILDLDKVFSNEEGEFLQEISTDTIPN